MEPKTKKFHITITNNETNKVEIDTDTAAIIGVFDTDDSTATLVATACGGLTLSTTIAGCMKALKTIQASEPIGYMLAELMLKAESSETEENK